MPCIERQSVFNRVTKVLINNIELVLRHLCRVFTLIFTNLRRPSLKGVSDSHHWSRAPLFMSDSWGCVSNARINFVGEGLHMHFLSRRQKSKETKWLHFLKFGRRESWPSKRVTSIRYKMEVSGGVGRGGGGLGGRQPHKQHVRAEQLGK